MASIDIYSKQQVDSGFQKKPAAAGTAGQVLGLDNDLLPVWLNQSGGGSGMSPTAYTGDTIISAMYSSANGSIACIGGITDDNSNQLSGNFIKVNSTTWIGPGLWGQDKSKIVAYITVDSNANLTVYYANSYGSSLTSYVLTDNTPLTSQYISYLIS